MAILATDHLVTAIDSKSCNLRVTTIFGTIGNMVMPMSMESLAAGFEKYHQGELIQNAFPELSVSEREFIMTGMTDDEWNEQMGDEE